MSIKMHVHTYPFCRNAFNGRGHCDCDLTAEILHRNRLSRREPTQYSHVYSNHSAVGGWGNLKLSLANLSQNGNKSRSEAKLTTIIYDIICGRSSRPPHRIFTKGYCYIHNLLFLPLLLLLSLLLPLCDTSDKLYRNRG